MDVPDELRKWVVKCRKRSNIETEFLLRNFLVENVKIKISEKNLAGYSVELLYTDDEENDVTLFMNNIRSVNAQGAMFKALKLFIKTESANSNNEMLF
jgi:hypothetical protein